MLLNAEGKTTEPATRWPNPSKKGSYLPASITSFSSLLSSLTAAVTRSYNIFSSYATWVVKSSPAWPAKREKENRRVSCQPTRHRSALESNKKIQIGKHKERKRRNGRVARCPKNLVRRSPKAARESSRTHGAEYLRRIERAILPYSSTLTSC